MLDPIPVAQTSAKDRPPTVGEKVTCFVCKKEVDKEHSKQLPYSREKKVWVCEGHIK
jgi:DNA repair exonuclease SbcCD ATPase subunit